MTTTQKTYLHIIQELENKDVDLVMKTLSVLFEKNIRRGKNRKQEAKDNQHVS